MTLQTERGLHYIFSVLARCVKHTDQAAAVCIPDTLFYQHGSLRLWYSQDPDSGEIIKRDKRDCTKDRIIEFLGAAPPPGAVADGVSRRGQITEAASRKARSFEDGLHKSAPPNMPVAMYLRYISAPVSHDTGRKRPHPTEYVDGNGDPIDVLSLEYLDRDGLIAFLNNNREPKHNSLLQRFTYGKTHKTATIQVCWSPHAIQVHHRQNVHHISDPSVPIYDRCTTSEASPHDSIEMKTTPLMISRLAEECKKIVLHVAAVELRQVVRMVAVFTFDERQRATLLWVSELQMTTQPMSQLEAKQALTGTHVRNLLYLCPHTCDGAAVAKAVAAGLSSHSSFGGARAARAAAVADIDSLTKGVNDKLRSPSRCFSACDTHRSIAREKHNSHLLRAPLFRQNCERSSLKTKMSVDVSQRTPQFVVNTITSDQTQSSIPIRYCAGGGSGFFIDQKAATLRRRHQLELSAQHKAAINYEAVRRREAEDASTKSYSDLFEQLTGCSEGPRRSLRKNAGITSVFLQNGERTSAKLTTNSKFEELEMAEFRLASCLTDELLSYFCSTDAMFDSAIRVTDELASLVAAELDRKQLGFDGMLSITLPKDILLFLDPFQNQSPIFAWLLQTALLHAGIPQSSPNPACAEWQNIEVLRLYNGFLSSKKNCRFQLWFAAENEAYKKLVLDLHQSKEGEKVFSLSFANGLKMPRVLHELTAVLRSAQLYCRLDALHRIRTVCNVVLADESVANEILALLVRPQIQLSLTMLPIFLERIGAVERCTVQLGKGIGWPPRFAVLPQQLPAVFRFAV